MLAACPCPADGVDGTILCDDSHKVKIVVKRVVSLSRFNLERYDYFLVIRFVHVKFVPTFI